LVGYDLNISIDYNQKPCYIDSHPRSLRGVSGDILKAERGVASCGGARNRWPREAREVARQALRPGCEELAVPDPTLAEASAEAGAGERSAAPGPKTATVEPPRGERPAS